MHPVYKVSWDETQDLNRRVAKSVSAWSSQNWIAFAIGYNWKHPSKYDIDTLFICSPDQPWETYAFPSGHGCQIKHIEWDDSGQSLLTVDENGVAKLWDKDDNFINKWKCMETMNLGDGSSVEAFIWINSQRKHLIDVEKTITTKDLFQKFPTHKSESPIHSLTEKNNCFACITSDGAFKMIMKQESLEPNVQTVQLGSMKFYALKADMCINDSGKIFVGIQTDTSMIELFTVTCKPTASGVDLTVDVWPCVVPSFASSENANSVFKITEFKCVSFGANDQVIVCSKQAETTCIQVFEIRKEQLSLHPCFSKQPVTQHSDTSVCLKTFKLQLGIQAMFITRLQFQNLAKTNVSPLSPKLVILDASGTVHVYSLHNWVQTCPPTLFKMFQSEKVVSGTFSPCDQCLLTVTDQGNIFVFTLPHFALVQEKLKVNSIVNLLQYCMVESIVPWDLLLSISSNEKPFIDQCYQNFLSEFSEFNQFIQKMSFLFLSNMKSMFYQLSKDNCGIVECRNTVLLSSVYHYVVGQLQSEKDATFMDAVQRLCASNKEVDIVKLVPMLDSKDVTILAASDSSQRSIVQWVTDYAVHVVRLILSKTHHGQNWKLILTYLDASCLLQLRQLLLIFYVMYQKASNIPHVHPIFITMAHSLDITAQLFRLISKLHQLASGDAAQEVAMADLSFSNIPFMYLEFPSENPRRSVLSSSKISAIEYDEYEFQLNGDSWENIHRMGTENPLSLGVSTVNTCLRQIYDGIHFTPTSLMQGEIVKQCCQCGCLTIHQKHSSRLVNNIWDQCWRSACYCGGFWKKVEWYS